MLNYKDSGYNALASVLSVTTNDLEKITKDKNLIEAVEKNNIKEAIQSNNVIVQPLKL